MIKNLNRFHIDLVDNPYFIEKGGKPGQKLNIDGKDIPEKIKKFVPDCNDSAAGPGSQLGFSCNDALNPFHTVTGWDKNGFLKNVCDTNDVCSFGWGFDFHSSTSLCPDHPDKEKIPSDVISKYGSDIADKFYLMAGWFFRKYNAGGNTDCGCTGKGYVSYSGSTDCIRCDYRFDPPIQPIQPPAGPIAPPPTQGVPPTPLSVSYWIYKENAGNPKTICGCIWTDELDIKGVGYNDKIYVSTLAFPSYYFNQGTKLEISDTGAIRELGCGGEFQMNCNDVN